MREVAAIVSQGSGESLAQAHSWFPAQRCLDAGVVRVIVADVDALALWWIRGHGVFAAAMDFQQQRGQVLQTDDVVATDVEGSPVCLFARGRLKQRFHDIVNVGEIAKLPPVPNL